MQTTSLNQIGILKKKEKKDYNCDKYYNVFYLFKYNSWLDDNHVEEEPIYPYTITTPALALT
jgi:3-hydroxymyristoyl/3-hydroxydecanoyl-(acyl carrier protein) dehydratase